MTAPTPGLRKLLASAAPRHTAATAATATSSSGNVTSSSGPATPHGPAAGNPVLLHRHADAFGASLPFATPLPPAPTTFLVPAMPRRCDDAFAGRRPLLAWDAGLGEEARRRVRHERRRRLMQRTAGALAFAAGLTGAGLGLARLGAAVLTLVGQ